MSADEEPRIGLANGIEAIRAELSQAMRQGRGEDIHFRLGPVELELQLQLSTATGIDAGVRVWVVSVGGKHDSSYSTVHRVKLVLQPVDESGHDIKIHDLADETLK